MLARHSFTVNPFRQSLFSQFLLNRQFSQKVLVEEKQNKPYRRTTKPECYSQNNAGSKPIPTQCDVLIIGGGGMGSSTAYFLKKKAGRDLNVVVVEKDSTYTRASTPLSAGCLRQQFTVAENILMSRFGAEFLHSFKKEVTDEVDPNFRCNGNLYLVNESNAEALARGVALQNKFGVKSQLMTKDKLKEKFPWLNTEGVCLAAFGCHDEGWFDPWALLMGLKKKAQALGVTYVDGEVVDFKFKPTEGEYDIVDQVVIKQRNNEQSSIKFDKCVLSAGAFSGEIAKKARIGVGPGLLGTPLPIEPRKRYMFVFNSHSENTPPTTAPLILDTSQTYFRREGVNFICGRSPSLDKEPSVDNLDVDLDFFETDMWPHLAHRVPAFESLKVVSAWAGFYDYNRFDCNGVIGKHPAYDNFYIAAGFSGHGVQKVPAVGRSVAELIVDGGFKTIDLSLMHFNRIVENRPIKEMAIA